MDGPANCTIPNDASYGLTVLRAAQRDNGSWPTLVKSWRLVDGQPVEFTYDRALWFTVERVSAATLPALLAVFRTMAMDRRACVVRGDPLPGCDVRRTRRLVKGPLATFRDAPRCILPVDVDSLPTSADPVHEALECAKRARDELPPEFHGAACIVQLTAGAGMKDGMRLRLWFMLARPITGAEAKAWLHSSPVDLAVYSAVEPVYTGSPLFHGIHDPCALVGRWALLDGHEQTVEVPDPIPDTRPEPVLAWERGEGPALGVEGYLSLCGDGPELAGFYRPITSAVGAWVRRKGPAAAKADAGEIQAAIVAAVAAAPKRPGRGADLDRYCGQDFIGEAVGSFAARDEADWSEPDRARAAALAERFMARLRARREVAKAAAAAVQQDQHHTTRRVLVEFRAKLMTFLANPNPRDLGIRLPPGMGKTTTVLEMLPKGTTALFLVPTLKLAREGAEKARQLGHHAGVFYGKSQPGICPFAEQANALGSVKLSSARFLCGKPPKEDGSDADEPRCPFRMTCPWWSQHGEMTGRVTFASSNYFIYASEKLWPEFDVIVVDEKIYSSITDNMTIDIDDIAPEHKTINAGHSTIDISDPDRYRLLQLRLMIESGDSPWDYPGRPERRQMAFMPDYFAREELEELADRQRRRAERLAPRPGQSKAAVLAAVKEIRRQRLHERATLLELLADGHGRPGLGERVTWQREPEPETEADKRKPKRRRLRLHIRKARTVEGKKLIVTDADLDPLLSRYVFQGLEVLDYDVRVKAAIFQVVGPYTRKLLCGWYRHSESDRPYKFTPKSLAEAAAARARLERAIARVCADGRPTLVVAIRDLIAPDPDRPAPPEGHEALKLPESCERAWFGGTLGLNTWAGVHRVIVIGSPGVPALDVEGLVRAVAGNWPAVALDLPGDFIPVEIALTDRRGRAIRARVRQSADEVTAAMQAQLEEANIWQSANRGRFIHRKVPGEIVAFGKVELRQEPDAVLLPHEVERAPREELALERFGVAPLSARELAEALGGRADAIRFGRKGKRVVGPPYKVDESYKADLLPFPQSDEGPLSPDEAEAEIVDLTATKPVHHGLSEELFGVLSRYRGEPFTMITYRRAGQSGRGSPHKAALRGLADAAEGLTKLEGAFGVGEVHSVKVLGRFGALSSAAQGSARATARCSGTARKAA